MVGVIGLGIMGSAIARNIEQASMPVVGTDVNAATRRRLKSHLSAIAPDAAGVLARSNRLITSLPGPGALDQVCDALIQARSLAPRGRVILAETSTLALADKQRAHDRLAQVGITMLDTPLSGTGAQARTGDLSVYAGGDASALRLMRPILARFSRSCHEVGGFGAGTRMKLVANLLVAVHNVAAAEAILFGQQFGLDADTLVSVLGDGAGASRMLQVRGPAMAQRTWREATMKVQVWQKDMRLINEALEQLQVPAPLFAACGPIYHAAMAQGHALHDTASVYAVLERLAGAAR